jgi:uncharacterized protein YbjT (DUF2867 family)
MGLTNKGVIAVFGATGQQGSGVVRALQASGEFKVRALTRDPERHGQLDEEVVKGDLDHPETLKAAFKGVYMVSFWSPTFGKQVLTRSSRPRRRYALPKMQA